MIEATPTSPTDLSLGRVVVVTGPGVPGVMSPTRWFAIFFLIGISAVIFTYIVIMNMQSMGAWIGQWMMFGCFGVFLVCGVVAIVVSRKRMRPLQERLEALLAGPQPLHIVHAVHAAIFASRVSYRRARSGSTELFPFDMRVFRAFVTPATPRIICVDVQLPPIPPPVLPGEVVRPKPPYNPFRIVMWIWFALLLLQGTPFVIGVLASGVLPPWHRLPWNAVLMAIFFTAAWWMSRRPGFISPGRLIADAAGDKTIADRDTAHIVIGHRPTGKGLALIVFPAKGTPIPFLYTGANDPALLDFLGRWLMPVTHQSTEQPVV